MALLRGGYSLRPDSTSALCGLASAAVAATISNVVHPHEAGVSHLAVHGLAICMIVVANRVLGYWVLDTKKQRPVVTKALNATNEEFDGSLRRISSARPEDN
jgi:hypothetical protein